MNNFNIWSYWDGSKNDVVKKCEKSWEKYLDKDNVSILDKDKVSEHDFILPKKFNDLEVQLKSDIVRLNLLYRYGGIWFDKSIRLNEDISWLERFCEKNGLDNYYMPKMFLKNYPENWLIISPKKENKNILKLLTLMNEIIDSQEDYADSYIYECECKYGNTKENKKYYLFYQSFCYLDKNDPDFQWPKILPINADTTISKFLDLPTAKLKKYSKGGRQDYSSYVNYLILFLILFLIYYKLL